ncbi:M20 family metallopeptidase [Anaerobacillus alkalilacustris]
MSENWILARAHQLKEEMIQWRRHLHKNPELSFQEYDTALFIKKKFACLPNVHIETGVGWETAVIATISGGSGPTIAVRADIDALPIVEEATHNYQSEREGVMHACGHDAHTAIALAVATILSEASVQNQLPGTVKFIFQPAEEATNETGKTGAQYLVEAGVLSDVDCILALHVSPEHAVGEVLIHDGYSMANVDVFQVTIQGTGGHGAYPHLGTDPIWMLGPVLQAIHGIVARNISPLDAAVISIGELKGGSASNIIPSDVFLQGTLRSYSPHVREELITKLERAISVVETFGGNYDFTVNKGEPALYNNPEVNQAFRETVKQLFPEIKKYEIPFGLGGEDFSHMTNEVPGAMFFLGCSTQDGKKKELHTPIFDIDERCLPIGASIVAYTVLKFLEGVYDLPNKEHFIMSE